MIRIFKGFEIDGSDTSFYLLTDKKETIPELVSFFLDLPIFDRDLEYRFNKKEKNAWAPHRSSYDETINFTYADREKILSEIKLCAENNDGLFFDVPCKIPVLLSHEIKKELSKYTESRPEGEKENNGMKNPEGSLNRDDDSIHVSLTVTFKKNKSEPDYEGMVLNRDSLERLVNIPAYCISLGCGPGFYYEYAAWIMNKIAAAFPDVGIEGGLDCGGAFTGGCTYANSIYAFERIELPWKKAEFALEKLTALIEPTKAHSFWKEDRKKITYYGDNYLQLTNPVKLIQCKFSSDSEIYNYLDKFGEKDNAIKHEDYQEFCTRLFSMNITNEEFIAATAINIMLKHEKPTGKKLKSWEQQQDEFSRKAFLVSTRKDNHIACELWIWKKDTERVNLFLNNLSGN